MIDITAIEKAVADSQSKIEGLLEEQRKQIAETGNVNKGLQSDIAKL